MNKNDLLLISPPWTPHLGQGHFEVISPLLLDTTKSFESTFDFSQPETPSVVQNTHINAVHSSQHKHKRYLSFPLASLPTKLAPTSYTHSRTMSCMTSHEGLGISMFDDTFYSQDKSSNSNSSAPASPTSGDPTPVIMKEEMDEFTNEMDDLPSPTDQISDLKSDQPLTAAEIRAEKRKMKRFRLTHQQTRYLMSEFARQAHPDAAHRERLSRAIPGLSSRQVQVWFQNRRAKLKRVTQDDRDNIVRSRALPDNFDLSSALRSPFGPSPTQNIQAQTPTSHPCVSSMEHTMRPIVAATPRLHSRHTSIASNFMSPTSQPSMNQPTPLPQDIARTSSLFSPNGFQLIEEESQASFASERLHNAIQASQQMPLTPQTSDFNASPVDAAFSGSPAMSPYGLGFSYGSIPGFQSSSYNSRNYSKHPGKVLIPRKNYSAFSVAAETPTCSSSTCSPLGMPMGFPVLSAPASVACFPNYIQ